MDINKAINQRYSIREFENKKVSDKIIKELITSASKAPSAKNEQNYMFYAVSSKNKLKKIALLLNNFLIKNKEEINHMNLALKEIIKRFYQDMGGAQNIIFVYRQIIKNPPSYQLVNDIAGISCAIENLMLSAVSKGLGTCWIGSFKDKEKIISNLIGAKDNEKLVASILIGYPKKGYLPLKRDKKGINEILKIV